MKKTLALIRKINLYEIDVLFLATSTPGVSEIRLRDVSSDVVLQVNKRILVNENLEDAVFYTLKELYEDLKNHKNIAKEKK